MNQGRSGIDQLLVVSQVILSIVLPFVTFPLIYVTSSRTAMRVRKPTAAAVVSEKSKVVSGSGAPYIDHEIETDTFSLSSGGVNRDLAPSSTFDHGTIRPARRMGTEVTLTNSAGVGDDSDFYDYSNGWFLASAAYSVWFAVLCANMYSLYQIGSGQA